ncbi:MAG: hypothetical protein M1812_003103 [Candelaria pacifica]|nr:MAG: hypothetical protein M1812_003103 [Candelaria pacifica]
MCSQSQRSLGIFKECQLQAGVQTRATRETVPFQPTSEDNQDLDNVSTTLASEIDDLCTRSDNQYKSIEQLRASQIQMQSTVDNMSANLSMLAKNITNIPRSLDRNATVEKSISDRQHRDKAAVEDRMDTSADGDTATAFEDASKELQRVKRF